MGARRVLGTQSRTTELDPLLRPITVRWIFILLQSEAPVESSISCVVGWNPDVYATDCRPSQQSIKTYDNSKISYTQAPAGFDTYDNQFFVKSISSTPAGAWKPSKWSRRVGSSQAAGLKTWDQQVYHIGTQLPYEAPVVATTRAEDEDDQVV